MASCCITDDTAARPCPDCAATGAVVGAAPVRAHRPTAEEGPWQYCSSPACEVLFYLDDRVVKEDEARARVGEKALSAPEPVCFCFAHTTADIVADVTTHGTSTIKSSIQEAVAHGSCACEHLNPSGRCCLGAVNRAIKTADADRRPSPAATAAGGG
jgi:hypothetical protein